MHTASKRTMLTLALLAGLMSCGGSNEQKGIDKASMKTKPEAGEASGLPAISAPERFVVHRTSWDAPDANPEDEPEEPPIEVSWEEGQRQKLNREGAKRWKNTEVYIRGR